MEAVGRCGLEIVSRWLTRVTSQGADLASSALLQIFPPNSASHSDRLRVFPRDGRTCLEPSSIVSQRNVHRPVAAAPCGDCGTAAKHYEE
jgi:hypothetical protein